MKPAVQMYTLREFTRTLDGLDEALRRVAAMTYGGVQLSAVGAWDEGLIDARGLRDLLDRHELACCATHRPVRRLLENTDEEIEIHRTLGCTYVAVGSIAGDYGMETDSYRRFADDFAPVIARLKAEGIALGYHNHAHEFMHQENSRQRDYDRRPRYDVLLDVPDLMLEIDTYWVAISGYDPAALIQRAAGRVPVVHLKDLEIVGWEGPKFAPVGEGNLDWGAILDACEAGGTEWLVVEQDVCRRDPFDCLSSSQIFLNDLENTGAELGARPRGTGATLFIL